MGMLRLPSPFSFPSVSLGLDTACDTGLFFAPYKVPILTLSNRIFRLW